MSGSTAENADFKDFLSTEGPDVVELAREASGRQTYLKDSERLSLYKSFAGLISAGVSIERAVSIVASELRKNHTADIAIRLEAFFDEVLTSRDKSCTLTSETPDRKDLGEAAEKCFGKGFLSTGEIMLLRGLSHADDIARIFDYCADIIILCADVPSSYFSATKQTHPTRHGNRQL